MASGTNYSFSKEMSIRKRITSIFNKREEDFPTLREYNDYLEEVEDMTFNLIEGIDVPAIEAAIAKYQEENAEQIVIARARKAEELAAALKASKNLPQNDANDMNTGNGLQQGSVVGQGFYAPTAHPTGMALQPLPIGGVFDPLQGHNVDDEETLKLKAERGARAGGWTPELGKKRALEEAFSSIWL